MKSDRPPDRIVGNKIARDYKDAIGHPVYVGAFVCYVTRSGSSVYINYGRVKEILDTDEPAYIGYESSPYPGDRYGRRVLSWDYAYKIKLIPYEFDKLLEEFVIPKHWDSALGKSVRQTEDDVKLRTITAVERVHVMHV